MPQDLTQLRIEVDGIWTAADVAHFMTAVDDLYNLGAALHELRERRPRFRQDDVPFIFVVRDFPFVHTGALAENLVRGVAIEDRLHVSRYYYGSKGFTDLAGIGKIMEEIRKFFTTLIEHHASKDERREKARILAAQANREEIRGEREREELNGLKIKNAREFLALRRDYREIPAADFRQLVGWVDDRQEVIDAAITEGRVVKAVLAPPRTASEDVELRSRVAEGLKDSDGASREQPKATPDKE